MEKSRAHIFVSGIVQGVFYRASAVRQVNQIGGITGWARNLRDGRVEITCEGDQGDLEKLVSWLWKGPEFAKVTDVDVVWENATGEFSDFNVRS